MFWLNKIEKDQKPEYICYLSYSKVDNLYSQISTMDIKEINSEHLIDVQGDGSIETDTILKIIKGKLALGGRESRLSRSIGEFNYLQKFGKVIEYCYQNHKIVDLNKFILNKETGNFLLYTVTSRFLCGKSEMNKDIIDRENKRLIVML